MFAVLRDAVRQKHRGYSGARPDVVQLIPRSCTRILDVGCGAGMTARMLHERDPKAVVIGVEPDAALAAIAGTFADQVVSGAIDHPRTLSQLSALEPFDAIILADVLEHLVDPWTLLTQIKALLSPLGVIVTSIPNVRHVSTFVALAFTGDWPLRERGIHDRTHLRWFTRSGILDMARAADLRRVGGSRNLRLIESAPWSSIPAKCLDFWPLRGFLTFQYLDVWIVGNEGGDDAA